MDLRDPNYTPDGWVKTLRNRRIVFLSPKPERIIVQGKAMLKDLQRQGRFVEVDLDRLDFRGLVAKVSEVRVLGAVENEAMEVDEVEAETSVEIPSIKKTGADQQRDLVVSRTKMLESVPDQPVNHKLELDKASGILRQVLENSENLQTNIKVQNLREKLTMTDSDD